MVEETNKSSARDFPLGEVPVCAICFLGMNHGLAATDCGHVFHSDCIQKALEGIPGTSTKKCPLCRNPTTTNQLLELNF